MTNPTQSKTIVIINNESKQYLHADFETVRGAVWTHDIECAMKFKSFKDAQKYREKGESVYEWK